LLAPPLTRDEIRSIYLQGEAAVVALLEQFQARLIQLEEQIAKNSSNSSKPPSSDGLGKKPLQPMSLRKKTGKKVGGQPGHQGTTLTQVDQPDEIVEHRPTCCPDCQSDLTIITADGGPVCRLQVFEMPEPKVIVTEHRAVLVSCPDCGKSCRGAFPENVTQPTQYGPRLLGFATYLHGVHLLPFARCAEIVREMTGTPFSPSCLDRALQTAHRVLEPFEVVVKSVLAHVSLKHADETGTRVDGKLNWFHVHKCVN